MWDVWSRPDAPYGRRAARYPSAPAPCSARPTLPQRSRLLEGRRVIPQRFQGKVSDAEAHARADASLHRLILLAEPTAACHPTFKSLGQKCSLSQFISGERRTMFVRPADGDHSQSSDGMGADAAAAICLSAGLYVPSRICLSIGPVWTDRCHTGSSLAR